MELCRAPVCYRVAATATLGCRTASTRRIHNSQYTALKPEAQDLSWTTGLAQASMLICSTVVGDAPSSLQPRAQSLPPVGCDFGASSWGQCAWRYCMYGARERAPQTGFKTTTKSLSAAIQACRQWEVHQHSRSHYTSTVCLVPDLISSVPVSRSAQLRVATAGCGRALACARAAGHC